MRGAAVWVTDRSPEEVQQNGWSAALPAGCWIDWAAAAPPVLSWTAAARAQSLDSVRGPGPWATALLLDERRSLVTDQLFWAARNRNRDPGQEHEQTQRAELLLLLLLPQVRGAAVTAACFQQMQPEQAQQVLVVAFVLATVLAAVIEGMAVPA